MNLRHIVAFTLIGWYLMIPPMAEDNPKAASAPLSQWKVSAAFDSGDRCTWFLRDVRDDAKKESVKLGEVVREHWSDNGYTGSKEDLDAWINAKGWELALGFAQCIASDDPRLAK
jgi:hypothetical protein